MAMANKNTKRSVGRFNENSRSFAHETSSGIVCEVSIIRLQKLKIEQKIFEIIQDFLSFLKSSYKLTELFIFQDYMWLICDINRLINRCYLQNNQKFDRTYYNRYRQTNALTKIISMIIICIKRFLVNFSAAILICSLITSEIDYLVVE